MTADRLVKGARVRSLVDDGFVHVGLVGTVFQYTDSRYLHTRRVLVVWETEISSSVVPESIEVIG